MGRSVSGVAHCPQKANPGGLAKPHCGQGPVSGVAHCPQNFIPAGFSNPQLGQRIGPLRGSDYAPEMSVMLNDRRRVRHDRDKLARQYPRARDKSSKIPDASMRMGPITGSIGESWPLFVPSDERAV